jgi:phosphotriesterase-related protein
VPIYTVLGPIEPDELGPTSMHEHLLCDGRVWCRPSPEEPPAHPRVTIENLGYVRWNLLSMEDNMLLDDPGLIAQELAEVRRHGGSGIVDLTVVGLGQRVADLPGIARATGLHVIVGCGYYVEQSHPEWLRRASVDDVREALVAELRTGIGDTGVIPSLIGEIGTNYPVTDQERKVLRAAAQAAVETGVAVNVHLSWRGHGALDVIELLLAEGMQPDRMIMSHMDEVIDRGYHLAVAETGVTLEFDTFGTEFYYGGGVRTPTDTERMEHLRILAENGYAAQLVLGCDVWVKANLRRYGGMGYEHLLKRIVPTLKSSYGLDDEAIETMLVRTPRRLLDRPAVSLETGAVEAGATA